MGTSSSVSTVIGRSFCLAFVQELLSSLRHPVTTTTEDRVTAVALDLFRSHGYAVTSMEQVQPARACRTAAAHLFPNKATLAARLYCDGMIECQDAIIRTDRSATPRRTACARPWRSDPVG